jgi:hypothetical protein
VNTGPAAGGSSIHILQARLRAARFVSTPAGSRLGSGRIPISTIGVAPPPAANALCGVRPAAAKFAAAPPCIRRGHPGDPQATCRGAPADYRVEQRLLLRIHLLVTAVAVSGMHRAVLNQFAQPRILGVESAHALEVIDLRGDARSIRGDGRGRMYSLECFHSPRLRARGVGEPCCRAQNRTLQWNGSHEFPDCDIPLFTIADGAGGFQAVELACLQTQPSLLRLARGATKAAVIQPAPSS